MVHVGELVARLRAADQAWSTAQGTSRQWRHQELVSAAFARHFEHRAQAADWARMTATRDADGQDDTGDDGTVESVLAVASDACGRRRRAETISRRGEEWMADLVVFDGPTYWARTGGIVRTNHGDERHGHGGTDVVNLLMPSRVADGYTLDALDEEEQVAGRRCTVAIAVPREPDPYGCTPESEIFDMIAGGTQFRLSIDAETGVLLRVVKMVDSTEAEICEFLDLTFDAPLSDDLFAPLT